MFKMYIYFATNFKISCNSCRFDFKKAFNGQNGYYILKKGGGTERNCNGKGLV